MLKKIIRTLCIIIIMFTLNINKVNEINHEIKINRIIKEKEEDYIEINKYRLLIKEEDEDKTLDDNLVYKLPISNEKRIFLAGHNNKLVFNRIYSLNENDEIIVSMNNKKYKYKFKEKRMVKVNALDIFTKIHETCLVLITCSNDNQYRLFVICEKIKLDS